MAGWAVNLAAYLAKRGHSVGLLDADIDTPNAPQVMGGDARPSMNEGRISPADTFGVKIVSMGFFQQNADEAIIMRGPCSESNSDARRQCLPRLELGVNRT